MWNDDLPSLIEGHGREMLEIPFATYSDTALGVDITNPAFPPSRFSTWNANPPDFMLRGLKSAFDALYERGAERAVMMPLVVHDFITGRPFRSKVLDEFLSYAKQFEGVVFTGHDELARWCRGNRENLERNNRVNQTMKILAALLLWSPAPFHSLVRLPPTSRLYARATTRSAGCSRQFGWLMKTNCSTSTVSRSI